jgi:hypothetical protein
MLKFHQNLGLGRNDKVLTRSARSADNEETYNLPGNFLGNYFFRKSTKTLFVNKGRIFSRVQPFYERAMSNLDRSMHRSLWVWVTHSSFIEGLHMTKNTASGLLTMGYPMRLFDSSRSCCIIGQAWNSVCMQCMALWHLAQCAIQQGTLKIINNKCSIKISLYLETAGGLSFDVDLDDVYFSSLE